MIRFNQSLIIQLKSKTNLKYIKSVMEASQIIQIQGHQKLNRLVLKENYLCDFEQLNKALNQCQEEPVHFEESEEANLAKASQQDNLCCSNKLWTQEETECLFDLFQKNGSKWTKISQLMKRKSENCIKNRFYGSLRKVLRRMNKAAKNLQKKFKKQLKFESITRIIDASQGLFRLKSPLKEESESLSKKIINLAKLEQHQMAPEQAEEMIKQINRFNMLTRSYKSQKKLTHQSRSAPKNKKDELENLSKSVKLQKSTEGVHDSSDLSQIELSGDVHEIKQQEQNFTPQLQQCLQMSPQGFQYLKTLEQFQFGTKREKTQEDLIIEELDMEILSPLQCEAWL